MNKDSQNSIFKGFAGSADDLIRQSANGHRHINIHTLNQS